MNVKEVGILALKPCITLVTAKRRRTVSDASGKGKRPFIHYHLLALVTGILLSASLFFFTQIHSSSVPIVSLIMWPREGAESTLSWNTKVSSVFKLLAERRGISIYRPYFLLLDLYERGAILPAKRKWTCFSVFCRFNAFYLMLLYQLQGRQTSHLLLNRVKVSWQSFTNLIKGLAIRLLGGLLLPVYSCVNRINICFCRAT